MKQPKKLTYEQKRYLVKLKEEPRDWMLQSEDTVKQVFVNKYTGQIIVREKLA